MEYPLYRVVAEQIEARISSGLYARGTQLPSEPAIAQEFNVSRITVRHALELLKRRGLLASKSGLGTLVRSDGSSTTSMIISGSLRDLIYYAAGTRYSAIDRRLVTPPPAIASIFGLAPSVEVFCFRGFRGREGGDNFCWEEIYIPEPLGCTLDNADLGTGTLFGRLERANGIQITEAEQTITAVTAPAVVARQLGIRARTPLLKVTRLYRFAHDRVVEIGISYYDPSKFEYVMRLLRD